MGSSCASITPPNLAGLCFQRRVYRDERKA
jgi:hypothetical protein